MVGPGALDAWRVLSVCRRSSIDGAQTRGSRIHDQHRPSAVLVRSRRFVGSIDFSFGRQLCARTRRAGLDAFGDAALAADCCGDHAAVVKSPRSLGHQENVISFKPPTFVTNESGLPPTEPRGPRLPPPAPPGTLLGAAAPLPPPPDRGVHVRHRPWLAHVLLRMFSALQRLRRPVTA